MGMSCLNVTILNFKYFHNFVFFFNTSEVVEPRACIFSSFPLEAFWVVTAILVHPHSALMLGIGAPVQVAPCIGGC